MRITTKDIIKMLPFETVFKDDLLGKFDSLDPDQKFNIEQYLWDAFDALYELRLQDNIKLAELKVLQNKNETVDQDFYKKIQEQTEQELLEQGSALAQTTDLAAARSAMEQIVKHIKASKMPIKAE